MRNHMEHASVGVLSIAEDVALHLAVKRAMVQPQPSARAERRARASWAGYAGRCGFLGGPGAPAESRQACCVYSDAVILSSYLSETVARRFGPSYLLSPAVFDARLGQGL